MRIDADEDVRGLDDAGQALIEDVRRQVLDMKVNVVLLLADPAALGDLDRLGAADTSREDRSFSCGAIWA